MKITFALITSRFWAKLTLHEQNLIITHALKPMQQRIISQVCPMIKGKRRLTLVM